MSLTLPAAKLALIIQIFSQEMSLAIGDYGGYVLKYVGDAVIAIFPGEHDGRQACKNALNCAKSMIEIIKECVSPTLKTNDLPEITVKVSLDYGEVLAVLYGKSLERAHIDIVSSSISMAAKMISYAGPNEIIVGQSVFKNFQSNELSLMGFEKLDLDSKTWSYRDESSGTPYGLYKVKQNTRPIL
jgi:class 3 adenylate cyclase